MSCLVSLGLWGVQCVNIDLDDASRVKPQCHGPQGLALAGTEGAESAQRVEACAVRMAHERLAIARKVSIASPGHGTCTPVRAPVLPGADMALPSQHKDRGATQRLWVEAQGLTFGNGFAGAQGLPWHRLFQKK